MKKESLFAAIDQRQAEILSWGDTFFDCAELGFQEVKTAAAITSLLDQWNIPYESGIAMTGIRVTLGSGSPHIAFVSDMDALPCKSKNGTVHSCGHSIQTTLALALIRALADCGLPKKTAVASVSSLHRQKNSLTLLSVTNALPKARSATAPANRI